MKKEILIIAVSLISLLLIFQFQNLEKKTETVLHEPETIPENKGYIVKMLVPAVDSEGNGVVTTLLVEAKPGDGRVLTDINHILFFVDTQNSIQIAKAVAENITGVNTSKIDLMYAIETNASAIGGPSAGAALTVATVAVLENKNLNSSVMITGTIEPDGRIGPIGSVEEKAKASKEAGALLFLVPQGQDIQTTYLLVKECKKTGFWIYSQRYCEIKYVATESEVNETGIKVKEVATIEEALKYFLT